MENGGDVVTLPCSHPYLLEDGDGDIVCSICKTTFSGDLRHEFVSELDLHETQMCPVHGDPLRMWCMDCHEPACGLCVFDKHPMNSHMVETGTWYISDTRKNLLFNMDRLHNQTRRGLARNARAFRACEAELLRLFRENGNLLQLDGKLKRLKDVVEFSTSVSTLDHARTELGRIQTKMWNIASIRDDDELDDQRGASAVPQQHNEDVNRAVESLGVQVGLGPGRPARLAWDNERLLVCARSGPSTNSQPLLQLLAVESLGSPSFPEVFLELSVGSTVLGIVYIRLWGHLRRAQNFLLLCTGSLGPSFLGSHFLSVHGRGKSGESIGAGIYRDAKGAMTSMPLLAGLEYGGIYQTEVSKGLLVASSGGNPELDCLYSIITGDGKGVAKCQCKFGWVVSGLEYLKEAAHHLPLEQVKVSQCGLVLPRHT